MSSTLQNILILAGIVLLVGLGYFMYTQNNNSTLQSNSVNNQAAAETAQFLARLKNLENVSLEAEFFSDERFTTLVSFTRPVTPEPYGKPNPFVSGN